ncbi:hypothetical protein GCM10020254_48350 [Streptomyces goshikiensis]
MPPLDVGELSERAERARDRRDDEQEAGGHAQLHGGGAVRRPHGLVQLQVHRRLYGQEAPDQEGCREQRSVHLLLPHIKRTVVPLKIEVYSPNGQGVHLIFREVR